MPDRAGRHAGPGVRSVRLDAPADRSRQRLASEMTWKGSTTWAAFGKMTE